LIILGVVVVAYGEAVKYLLEDNARSDVMKDELLLNKQMEKTTEFYVSFATPVCCC
jgi:hypothetical protein